MSFDYSKARATAERLINKSGGTGSIVKKGSTGGYDNYGDPLSNQPDVTITGLITSLLQYSNSEIDGQNIQMGDSYVFFHSGSASKIEIDMQATINGDTFNIKSVKSLSSVGGISVYTKLQLRK